LQERNWDLNKMGDGRVLEPSTWNLKP